MERRKLKSFLDDLLASGAVTAAAAVIGGAGTVISEAAGGATRRTIAGRVTTSSLFDLASLTKPVVATLALTLDVDQVLPLRRSVSRAVAHTGAGVRVSPSLARKRLGSLLRHRAGFQPWTPLFARCPRAEDAAPWLASRPDLLGCPRPTYSDLGYILWGWLAERTVGQPLTALVHDRVGRPLGLDNLIAPPGEAAAAVECLLGNGRERKLASQEGIQIPTRRAPAPGTVQDGNARFLGPSGHAGLFGSARTMWRLAAEWVQPERLLAPASVSAALAGRDGCALGWRRRPPETRGRAGLWYGHLGFTGCGVWFCAETSEVRVLLAHRSSISVRLDDWRRRFLEISV